MTNNTVTMNLFTPIITRKDIFPSTNVTKKQYTQHLQDEKPVVIYRKLYRGSKLSIDFQTCDFQLTDKGVDKLQAMIHGEYAFLDVRIKGDRVVCSSIDNFFEISKPQQKLQLHNDFIYLVGDEVLVENVLNYIEQMHVTNYNLYFERT